MFHKSVTQIFLKRIRYTKMCHHKLNRGIESDRSMLNNSMKRSELILNF